MTPFAITLYGQCCRRHVVGQQIVSGISVVHICWSICSLCCNLFLRHFHFCTWTVYSVSHHKHNLTYNMAACIFGDQNSNVTCTSSIQQWNWYQHK